MEANKSITDVINLTNNSSLLIPVKTETFLKLKQTDPLPASLFYLSKSYSANIWKSADSQNNHKIDESRCLRTDFQTSLFSTIELLYGYSVSGSIYTTKIDTCPHLLNLRGCSYTKEEIQLDYDVSNLTNLRDILLYSPRFIDNNNEKILFIFYQLLKVYHFLHSLNLNCSELTLSDCYIDINYFLKVKLPLEKILRAYEHNSNQGPHEIHKDTDKQELCSIEWPLTQNISDIYNSYRHLTHNDLANITKRWCSNKINNFDYLLIINSISGRQWECPYSHPIFPWISDFESINTKLRDLSMSKFRLNKGDAHLDLTYQASLNSETGPYHITEFLSEITYFVYKSRVTDKETLCKNVRRTWVPNEYPQSIQRLYQWTPEECIPEFFYDPSIFSSIHTDLPDLKLPSWCSSAAEFIRAHRLLLESDLVSRKLHYWIDLTFGHKLTSEAALEAKNICMPLIDNHQSMKPYGITQLFSVPHPYKVYDKSGYHSEKMPKIINRSQQQLNESRKSIQKFESINEKSTESSSNIKIHLPDDYNPYLMTDQMESLYKFTKKAYHTFPQTKHVSTRTRLSFEYLCNFDMKCLACLLTELSFFNKIKCLPNQNSLQVRCDFICKMFAKQPHILMSGPFSAFIISCLKPIKEAQLSNKRTYFYDNVLKIQDSFNNIDTLLNSNLSCLPFKSFFESLYKFSTLFDKCENIIQNFDEISHQVLVENLSKIILDITSLNQNQEDLVKVELQLLKFLNKSNNRDTLLEGQEELELLPDLFYEQKFYLALYNLPKLMIEMSDPRKNLTTQAILYTSDSFDLIFPYLLSYFEHPKTCVNSFLYLFSKIAVFMSRTELVKKFLPILLDVLNIVDLNETLGIDLNQTNNEEKSRFCQLFQYTFINELRIIFGLRIFLQQICPLLIEAISGLKDFEYEIEPIQSNESNEPKANLNDNQQIFAMEGLNSKESNKAMETNGERVEFDFEDHFNSPGSPCISEQIGGRQQKVAFSFNPMKAHDFDITKIAASVLRFKNL